MMSSHWVFNISDSAIVVTPYRSKIEKRLTASEYMAQGRTRLGLRCVALVVGCRDVVKWIESNASYSVTCRGR